jgi:transcription antitermination factor NusG
MRTQTAALDLADESLFDDLAGSWFLLRTRSRHEKIVANDLASRGVHHFLPLMTCTRSYSQRQMRVELPVFPGCVFVRGAAEDVSAAEQDGTLTRAVAIADQARVNEELRNIALALKNDAELTESPYLHGGIGVEVRSGPFRGLRGIIEDGGRNDRLILQVQILGRAVSLEVDAAQTVAEGHFGLAALSPLRLHGPAGKLAGDPGWMGHPAGC